MEVAEAADANGASFLRVLVPLLWKRLHSHARRRLRACCREARTVASRTAGELRLEHEHGCEPAWRDDAVLGLRSMLGIGCRPRSLALDFCRGGPISVTATLGLRLLAELRAVVPPLPLAALALRGLPLTEEVVRAIAEAVPLLDSLTFTSYALSYGTVEPGSLAPSSPSTSGVQGLLRLNAPQLQRLSLCGLSGLAGPQALADGLASHLLRCSRLEALSLHVPITNARRALADGVHCVLRALPQLPALRSLELLQPEDFNEGAVKGEPWMLPSLPQLTRLVLGTGPTLFDLGGVMPVLARMRSLADLQLPSHKLRPSQLLQLAGLTALTRLHARGIRAAEAPASDDEVAGLDGSHASGAQPLVPLALPTRLRALVLDGSAAASDITALELPPGLRLQLPGIAVLKGDKDADGRLRPAAAEALLAACRQLAGRLCKCDKDLDAEAAESAPALALGLCSAAAPASWPDQYGTLFAALQPLGLRQLCIDNAHLTVLDVAALVRHLPLLEDLALDCAIELPSLALLHCLKRLHCLHLYPSECALLEEGWDSELALKAALLVLCAESPSLRDVNIWFHADPDEDLLAAAQDAADWLMEELLTLRSDPPTIDVVVMNDSDDDDDDEADGGGVEEGQQEDGGAE